jgi:hypothetical protein
VRIRCIYYSKFLFEVLINDSNAFSVNRKGEHIT